MNRKKILIVDDDIINLDYFGQMLPKMGYAVDRAMDGTEALEMIKHGMPDLILLDNIMPRMTGFELVKILKNDNKYKNIPIVMLSALGDMINKNEGYGLGIDDYITKPYRFQEILLRLNTVLRCRELYNQILMREKRLSLAEELLKDIKWNIGKLNAENLKNVVAELELKIKKTSLEMETIKNEEKNLLELETILHSRLVQE